MELQQLKFHLDVSLSVKAGDGDHDEISNEISIMMKPQCLLSTLAAGIFLFVW